MHVLATFPFSPEDREYHAVFATLDRLPEPAGFAGFELPAPILILPNVFEPALQQRLIDIYEAAGGGESGITRDGVGLHDHAFKRRRDYMLGDPELISATRQRIARRVAPEILRLLGMRITRIERYVIGCYAADEGGHFRAHRDDTSPVTAHRRFAVSINLNGDFDGGEVSFPEYSRHGYKAPPGWAIVFPGNILHAVGRVTRGRRYAFLPFVYDEAAARIRQENLARHFGTGAAVAHSPTPGRADQDIPSA